MGSWLRSPSSLMAKLSHAPKQPGSQTNPFSLQWPLGSLALIPPKKNISLPHPSICPSTHKPAQTLPGGTSHPLGFSQRRMWPDPPHGSSGQQALAEEKPAESTRGWQGRKLPTGVESEIQRGLPTAHPSLSMSPSPLLVWAPANPVNPCRSDRRML